MAKVVAVVVTYNRKDLLKECLEALEAQTYPFVKIVIVDNCSTDGTRAWLCSLDNAKYHTFFSEENMGGAGGFSIGIKEACKYKFDYVLVLDDDCILSNDYVEKLIISGDRVVVKNKKEYISALCGTVYENRRIATNHRGYIVNHKLGKAFDYWKEYKEAEYQKEYLKCDIASFCGLMISKKAIELVGYPKQEYFIKCDDSEYSMRLRKVGGIVNINFAVLNHKIKTDSSKNVFDWKYYYDVRNSIDMTKTNGFYLCSIKIIIKSLIFAIANINNKKSIEIWTQAVSDGIKGKLGKHEC